MQKALRSNFHIFFLGSLVFNLRSEEFPNHRFFDDLVENPVDNDIYWIWNDLICLRTLFFGKPRKIVNEVNLKFQFYSQKPELFHITFVV